MKRNCTLIFIFLMMTIPFALFAQQPKMKGIVKGKVVDVDSNAPLEYATISILSQKDSSIVTGDITDATGQFTISTRPGNHFVKIDFIGYQPVFVNDVVINRENKMVDLGTLKLGANAEQLQEIEVRAEKSSVQMSLDKRVFNVGKDLANTGGSAEDILDNVPSVAVDVEGNVSLRGSEGVQILVDGKPSGMIGIGGSGGLKNIPANLIDKVEVITNPSAKFEAEGAAGIINIVLRKEKKKGLNGSFDFTAGYPQILGTAINLNYRRKNFNFFTNLGINNRTNIGGGSSYQEFYDSLTTEILKTDREHNRGGITGSFRFGADYYVNKNNILTTSFNYRLGDENNLATIHYQDFLNSLDNPLGNSTRTDEEEEKESKLEYVLSYKRLLGKKGHELTADVRYQDNSEIENSIFTEKFFTSENIPSGIDDTQQRSNNEEGESRLITKLDYVRPFGKDGKFEAGYQGSYRNIRNDFLVEQLNDQVWEVFDGLSNNFNYEENIHAVYAMYGNKINKFSYQFGGRLEHSDVVTELLQTNEVNPRDYTNFFPTIHLTYDLPSDNAVQVSYSRRLRRPRFWDLNPFFTLSDARSRFSGNPDLDPEFTDSYEIGHIKYWEKGSLGSSIFYRHTTGVIQRIISDVIEVDSIIVTFRQPENLATRDDIGFEFNFSYNPVKWLRINGDMNLFRSITDGTNFGDDFSADTYTMSGRLTTRTTIKKKTDVQIRFNYRAPRETTQGRTKAMAMMDFGANRDILKNKGTLTLSIRDVFNSRRRRGIIDTENLFREEEFQWRGRTATLTLNYRLNQKKRRGGQRGGGSGGGGGDEF